MIVLSDLFEYEQGELEPVVALEYDLYKLTDLDNSPTFSDGDVFEYYIDAPQAVLDAIAADPNYEVIE